MVSFVHSGFSHACLIESNDASLILFSSFFRGLTRGMKEDSPVDISMNVRAVTCKSCTVEVSIPDVAKG